MPLAVVAGSTGFLGKEIVRQLLADGWEVLALHRKGTEIKDLLDMGANPVETDLTHPMRLHEAIPLYPDALFNVSGNTSQYTKDREAQRAINVLATKLLTEMAIGKRAKRFIHTSSISAFGLHKEVITEKTTSNADKIGHHYSYTKWLGQEYIEQAVRDRNLDAVIVSPAHIVGPGDKHGWIQLFENTLNDTLPGIPSGSGDFAHVKDVARAHIQALKKGKKGENYLIGGHAMSFLEIINSIQRKLDKKETEKTIPNFILHLLEPFQRIASHVSGRPAQLTPEKVKMITHHIHCDNSKAVKELGLEFMSKEEMVQDTLNWLKSKA